MIARDGRERLEAAIASLPEEWATALRLYALENRTYDEIADMMRCSLGTVRSRIYRSRARLHALLMDRADEAGS